MFDKLGQAKQMADEMKQKMEAITVTGEAAGGKVRVTANANKKVLETYTGDCVH